MAYPVTLNGRTYTLADFEGTNYVDGLPDAFEDFVTHAGSIYKTTSTTSNTIGTGSKSFTTADNSLPYQEGTPLRISDGAAPATNWMDGIVTAYSGTSLTVNVVSYAGSGTLTDWDINIGGGGTSYTGTLPIAQGGTGATTAGAAATNLGLGTGDSPSFAGLTVDTDTLYVDSTNNSVGVGTTSIATGANLHVDGTDTVLLITESDEGVATIRLGDTQADVSQSFAIEYDTLTQFANFVLDGTHRAMFNTGGDYVVGPTTASSPFTIYNANNDSTKAGIGLRYSGYIAAARYNDMVMQLNRMNSDGEILGFRSDGTSVGSIGAVGGDLGIGTGDCGIKFVDQNETIYPANPGSNFANNDATISLGVSTNRFKDLYLSGGVYLGGTVSANYLDDYEEGTWTPSVPSGFSVVGNRSCTYTKIGRLVHLTANLSITGTAADSTQLTISGLPFAQIGGNTGRGNAVPWLDRFVCGDDDGYPVAGIYNGATSITHWVTRSNTNANQIDLTAAMVNPSSDSEYQINIQYYAA